MNKKILILALLGITCLSNLLADELSHPVFPQKEGTQLRYRHYDSSGKMDASCVITLKNVLGNNTDGSLDMVYNCQDDKGKPYFGDSNEFTMKIKREAGQTYIVMDKMWKTIKVMDLITAGDVSTVKVPMTVGDTLADTKIFTTLGIFKATLTISDKKVIDHKMITVDGKVYESYLVHEKILTVTPFSTDTATADTWYAEGVGCLNQTVYDAKGKLKGRLEFYENPINM